MYRIGRKEGRWLMGGWRRDDRQVLLEGRAWRVEADGGRARGAPLEEDEEYRVAVGRQREEGVRRRGAATTR
jgi:hypothetical protein